MSDYYKPQRARNRFEPGAKTPFRISRAKVDLFLNCPRCFYLDVRRGVARPPSFPFTLNNAVDELMKREFDVHRANGTAHPLMKAYGIDAVPYRHPMMDEWREALRGGISFVHPELNLRFTGAPDDIWINAENKLHVVDTKATSKTTTPTLDADWQIGYKRQVEFYQWLLRQNGFPVDPTAYFVYVNARRDRESFDGRLDCDVHILPYVGDDAWVEPTIQKLKACLDSESLPDADTDCDYCAYRMVAHGHES